MQNQPTENAPVIGRKMPGRRAISQKLTRGRRVAIQVRDIDDCVWNVSEARATKYGFDLLFGDPAESHLLYVATSRGRLITTKELADFLTSHRTEYYTNFDLPACAPTITRVRRELGYHFFKDCFELWRQASPDLQALPVNQFAERYDVEGKTAFAWRQFFFGRKQLPANWWQHPEALVVLRSPMTVREMAAELGVSWDQASRGRRQVLAAEKGEVVLPKRLRPLAARWRTPELLAVISSDITNRELAQKLKISHDTAQLLRYSLRKDPELGPLYANQPLGRRDRPKNWWQSPEILAVLHSDEVLTKIGEKLGISATYACSLRRLTKPDGTGSLKNP